MTLVQAKRRIKALERVLWRLSDYCNISYREYRRKYGRQPDEVYHMACEAGRVLMKGVRKSKEGRKA